MESEQFDAHVLLYFQIDLNIVKNSCDWYMGHIDHIYGHIDVYIEMPI